MEDAPDSGPYSRAYVRYALVIIFLVAVFNVVDRTVVSMLVPGIRADLGLDDFQVGLLLGPSFAIVHFIAILPAAWLADRSSRRTIIAAGLFVWSGMTALGGLSQSFFQLFLSRMGVGIGEAAGSPPSVSLLTDTAPASMRARAISSITLGALMGIGVGLVVGGGLSEAYGWRVTLLAAGAPGIIVALLVRFTLREPPRSSGAGGGATPLAAARHLLSLQSYRWMILAVCFAGVATLGRSMWEPEFLRRVYGLSGLQLGLTLFLAGALPGAVGAFAGSALADRLAARDARWMLWICALGNLLATAPLAAFLLWPIDEVVVLFGREIPIGFTFLIVGGFFAGFYSPPVGAIAQSLSLPSMRALSHAIWTMIYTLVGTGMGPAIIGGLTDYWTPEYGERAVGQAILAVTLLLPISAGLFLLAAHRFRADLARVENAIADSQPE